MVLYSLIDGRVLSLLAQSLKVDLHLSDMSDRFAKALILPGTDTAVFWALREKELECGNVTIHLCTVRYTLVYCEEG